VVVPSDWLDRLTARFSEDTQLVSGPVAYREGTGFFHRAVELEMLGLVAAGGGAMANGHSNMCNGANLAYRRQAFDRVGGFESIDHVATGDDTLLMLKIASEHPRAVRFCPDPEALVITAPASGWREFINQRIRWSSQGLDHGDFGTLILAVLVWSFHALVLAGAAAALLMPGFWWPVGIALALKISAEALLLNSACRHFGRQHLMKVFLPAEIIQIPYVVAVGFLGVFGSGFSWKGRRLDR
jgi:cellulose synthase/poly-beta-1,6-N-acetylglucosamine synthase-like glycosyltransferase